MSESTHILEELRSLRIAHVDLMTRMSDVCGEVRTLVSELRHTQTSFDSMSNRVAEVDRQIRTIQLENATNKPILDIANSMYRSQWMTIIGAIGAVIGSNWTKLF
jgi:hypothetical protein